MPLLCTPQVVTPNAWAGVVSGFNSAPVPRSIQCKCRRSSATTAYPEPRHSAAHSPRLNPHAPAPTRHTPSAAIFGERDRLQGVSDNIMMGNMCPLGTGAFDLLLDETALEDAFDVQVRALHCVHGTKRGLHHYVLIAAIVSTQTPVLRSSRLLTVRRARMARLCSDFRSCAPAFFLSSTSPRSATWRSGTTPRAPPAA